MPHHSLVATAVTVRRIRSDSTERLSVNDLDGKGLSLLDLFYAFVAQGVDDNGWEDEKAELLVTPTDVQPLGRTVLMEHESGNYGSNGRIRENQGGATTYNFGKHEAPVIPKRSLFVVPVLGDYAVCVDQRIGNSALPKLFWREFRRAVRKHHKLLVDVSQSADAAAWNAFLGNADRIHNVTYIQEPDDIADGKAVPKAVGVRKYQVARDSDALSLPLELLDLLRNRENPKNRAKADKLVMLPKDFGEPSEVSVSVQTGDSTRSVDVISEDFPAFIYSLSTGGKEPSPDVFLSDSREVAQSLLEEELDCNLGPATWRDMEWSDTRLDQRLTGAGDNDDVDPDEALV